MLTFDQICELKVGDVFYEQGYGTEVELTVESIPAVERVEIGRQSHQQVAFKARGTQGIIPYMFTSGFMAYCPDIYLESLKAAA